MPQCSVRKFGDGLEHGYESTSRIPMISRLVFVHQYSFAVSGGIFDELWKRPWTCKHPSFGYVTFESRKLCTHVVGIGRGFVHEKIYLSSDGMDHIGRVSAPDFSPLMRKPGINR